MRVDRLEPGLAPRPVGAPADRRPLERPDPAAEHEIVATPAGLEPVPEQRSRPAGAGDDLVFGRTGSRPFERTTIRRRADRAWRKAGLEPIDPHECRHTYVSLMHAAGVPLERIGDYVGHTAKAMTDRYRHLVAGQAEDDAARLNAYLAAGTGDEDG